MRHARVRFRDSASRVVHPEGQGRCGRIGTSVTAPYLRHVAGQGEYQTMLAKFAAPVALAVASVFAATAADAAITITVQQSGDDVVMRASGSFDTSTAKTVRFASNYATWTRPFVGVLTFNGTASTRNTVYELTSDDRHFGSARSSDFVAQETSGTSLYVALSWGEFILPTAYVSGSAIESQAVYRARTLAGMGYVAGTYTAKVGSNDVSIVVGEPAVAAVPEASTWALMLVGFGAAGVAMRRRRATIAFA